LLEVLKEITHVLELRKTRAAAIRVNCRHSFA